MEAAEKWSKMAKYKVTFKTSLYVDVIVEADSVDDAISLAEQDVYVSGYCGNGGCDKLVGVSDSNMSVYADDDFEVPDADNDVKKIQ